MKKKQYETEYFKWFLFHTPNKSVNKNNKTYDL